MIRAFALALQLLTRLPTPSFNTAPRPEELGQSVLWFPIVGLLIGASLVGLNAVVLCRVDSGVSAALLLTIWVLITGGLHLDGLADSADAWIGGQGDRIRTLDIMKDSCSGPIAIVVVVLTLINKFAALQALPPSDTYKALLLAPVLGRTAIVLLLIATPYVRPNGLGAPYADFLPRRKCSALVLLIAAAATVWLDWQGGVLIAVLGISVLSLRRGLMARLGGVTGDTLGMACEWSETITLIALALVAR